MEEDTAQDIPVKNISQISTNKKGKGLFRKKYIIFFLMFLLVFFFVLVFIFQTNKQSGWNSYKNEDFNFAFQYPSGWSIEESVTEVNPHDKYRNLNLIIKNEKGDSITFSSDLDADNTRCKLNHQIDLGQEKITFADKNINLYYAGGPQASGIKENSVHKIYLSENSIPCYDNPSVYIEDIGFNAYGSDRSGNERFIIQLENPTPIDELISSNEMKTFRQLISSFIILKKPELQIPKQINQDISTWETFDHDSGFSFRYPSGKVGATSMSPPEFSSNVHIKYDENTEKEFGVLIRNNSLIKSSDISDYSKYVISLPLKEYTETIREENIKSSYESASTEGFTSAIKVSSISGKPSYEFENSDSFGYELGGFVTSGRYIFIFTEHNEDKYIIYLPVGDKIGEMILSTFEFTKTQPTNN